MKNGRLWLTVLSIVVAFYAFMTVFAIVAPPAVIHSITKYDWQTCFKMYVNEYSRIQQLETNQVEWTFVASGVISSLTLVSAIGLGFRFRWAQIALIVFGSVSLVGILGWKIWKASLKGPSSLIRDSDTFLFWATIVILLSLPRCRRFLGLNPVQLEASRIP